MATWYGQPLNSSNTTAYQTLPPWWLPQQVYIVKYHKLTAPEPEPVALEPDYPPY